MDSREYASCENLCPVPMLFARNDPNRRCQLKTAVPIEGFECAVTSKGSGARLRVLDIRPQLRIIEADSSIDE